MHDSREQLTVLRFVVTDEALAAQPCISCKRLTVLHACLLQPVAAHSVVQQWLLASAARALFSQLWWVGRARKSFVHRCPQRHHRALQRHPCRGHPGSASWSKPWTFATWKAASMLFPIKRQMCCRCLFSTSCSCIIRIHLWPTTTTQIIPICYIHRILQRIN